MKALKLLRHHNFLLTLVLFLCGFSININAQEHVQYNLDGQAHYNEGSFSEALVDFKKSIGVKPDYLKAHFNIAMTYYKEEYFDSAAKHFNRVIELDSNIELPYYYLPFCYYNNAESDEALKAFEKAIILMPKKRELYYYLAVLHASNGDKDLELQVYNGLLKLFPNEYKAIIQRANLYNETQEFEKALSDLDKAIELNEFEAEPYLLRGIIHINFGRIEEGCKDLTMAEAMGSDAPALLELKPQHCTEQPSE